jgi:hypothetical protein
VLPWSRARPRVFEFDLDCELRDRAVAERLLISHDNNKAGNVVKATCQFSSRWWWARRPPRPQRKGNRQSRVKGRQLETGKAKCRGREPRGGVRHGPRGGSVQGVHACTRGPSFEGAPSESGSGPPSAGGLHVPPRCGRQGGSLCSAPLHSTKAAGRRGPGLQLHLHLRVAASSGRPDRVSMLLCVSSRRTVSAAAPAQHNIVPHAPYCHLRLAMLSVSGSSSRYR